MGVGSALVRNPMRLATGDILLENTFRCEPRIADIFEGPGHIESFAFPEMPDRKAPRTQNLMEGAGHLGIDIEIASLLLLEEPLTLLDEIVWLPSAEPDSHPVIRMKPGRVIKGRGGDDDVGSISRR